MFERRLKIFLGCLFLVTIVLLLRAGQVQVIEHAEWQKEAAKAMTRPRHVETSRGRILDFAGRPIAVDEACTDACVDYRAISDPPDKAWVTDLARKYLRERMGSEYIDAPRSRQVQLRDAEVARINEDIGTMWARLAQIAGIPLEEVDQTRAAIIKKVELRRRSVGSKLYEKAIERHDQKEPVLWRRWLLGETDEPPDRDSFSVDVEEQFREHPVLRAVSAEAQTQLGKHLDRFPGLALRPSKHRYYPFGDVACHVVGHMTKVNGDDLQRDPWLGKDDLKRYYPDDLIGRTGIESLCEGVLRGTRGQYNTVAVTSGNGGWKEMPGDAPVVGADVRTTIDMELQRRVEKAFAVMTVKNADHQTQDTLAMHGAAVVIDVPTGQVRAMVSYPTYDVNRLDEEYQKLASDQLNLPLMNRATQSQLEPGSTVKPVVGLAGIAEGVVGVHQGIECTGYMVVNGRRIHNGFRCWVASSFESRFGMEGVKHHPFPVAHEGRFGNPDGFLIYADALERSCNVYFETVAGGLGTHGLQKWFDRFGLGRATGVGIDEAAGRLPSDAKQDRAEIQRMDWWAGIGQGQVHVTPIQMANVAATIARDGIWMRPTLLADASQSPPRQDPARVDLQLPPEAIAAAKEGMVNVVNSRAGTGKDGQVPEVLVAGKTGTATGSPLYVQSIDAQGNPLVNEQGKPIMERLVPSTHDAPNPLAPWYRAGNVEGTKVYHAWYIGFAPADNPRIAFAVMVQYGGSGGPTSGPVAREIVKACLEMKYLNN